MKWFKHMSDALDDPFIQSLLDEFGHKGYVWWFGLIEAIAKENGYTVTGEINVPVKFLARRLRLSKPKVIEMIQFCVRKSKLRWLNYEEIVSECQRELNEITMESQKNVDELLVGLIRKKTKSLHLGIPKFLELKDNYAKDLQAAGKKLSNQKEEEKKEKKEAKVEEEKEAASVLELFNQISGKKLSHVKGNLKDINERLKDKNASYTMDDFEAVISFKTLKWRNDIKMKNFIRPQTLFSADKFDVYLNEAIEAGFYESKGFSDKAKYSDKVIPFSPNSISTNTKGASELDEIDFLHEQSF